jgi:hypothetical protein
MRLDGKAELDEYRNASSQSAAGRPPVLLNLVRVLAQQAARTCFGKTAIGHVRSSTDDLTGQQP